MSIALYELVLVKNATSSDTSEPTYGTGLNLYDFAEAELFIEVELTGSSSSISEEGDEPEWTIVPLYGNPLMSNYSPGEAIVVHSGRTHEFVKVAHSPDFQLMVYEDEDGPASELTVYLRPVA